MLDERVRLESAREDSGVVIDPAALTVDPDATARLRAARGWTTPPAVSR